MNHYVGFMDSSSEVGILYQLHHRLSDIGISPEKNCIMDTGVALKQIRKSNASLVSLRRILFLDEYLLAYLKLN